jgi:hypothetical protein
VTETVTLALQGRVVQLGNHGGATVPLLACQPNGKYITIMQSGRDVNLAPDEFADLRDILNALAERET